MRKQIAMLLVLLLLVSACPSALAAKASLVATGSLVAGETIQIKTPFGGSVQQMAVSVGDIVSQGDLLFAMETSKIYAPIDGMVRGILAQPGDSASAVLSYYGALMYLEPNTLVVAINQSRAYESTDARSAHVGETVYLQDIDDSAKQGVGRVIGLGEGYFNVEISEHTLEEGDVVNAYRESNLENTSRLGRGTVRKQSALPISGDGSIVSLSVAEGSIVQKGDLLLEMGAGVFPGYTPRDASVYAPVDAIVTSVSAAESQSAPMDQVLVTLCPINDLEVSVFISETDLNIPVLGSSVRVRLDAYGKEDFYGTVTSISSSGTRSANTKGAQFEVRVVLEPDVRLLLGLSATVYFGEED